jgi:hypothetical protein
LWEVKAHNFDDVQTWYHEDLESYIRAKLYSYFEDCMEGESVQIDLVAEAAKLPIEVVTDFSDCIRLITADNDTNEVTGLELINLERDPKTNEYIYTIRDIIGIVFHAYCYIGCSFYQLNRPHPTEKIEFNRCEFTGTLSHSSNTLSVEQITYMMTNTFGRSYVNQFNSFPHYEEFIRNTIYKGLKNDYSLCSLHFRSVFAEEAGVYIEEPIYECPYSTIDFDAPNTTLWDVKKVIGSLKSGVVERQVDNEIATTVSTQLLYKNTITGKQQLEYEPIILLEEFELISDVGMKTSLGTLLLEHLNNVQTDKVLDVLDDIRKYMDIITAMFNIDLAKGEGNRQRELISKYVAKYKDDNEETIASQVIEKTHAFLSAFMQNKDINNNQIGQDLVDLGVKKTRKSRGYVYSMVNPSVQDLRTFTYEMLKSPRQSDLS